MYPNLRPATLIWASLTALTALLSPLQSTAGPTTNPGWDLFETVPGDPTCATGTCFMSVPFEGVPLGSFNFGGAIGVRGTGTTDTIVQRQDQANAPLDTIPIELVALHLRTVNPVNLGLGTGFYFITLQSERGGPASTGNMTITFAPEPPLLTLSHGTFDSLINVFFDVRFGSLSGPITLSDALVLTSDDVPWAHQSPGANVLEIPGVNMLLNGS